QLGAAWLQHFGFDAMHQRRALTHFPLHPVDNVDHHAVGDFFHHDTVVLEHGEAEPGIAQVNDAGALQPVEQTDDAQDTQPAEAAHGNAAEQVIPVRERVEEPAVIGAAHNGHDPADTEFGQINGHEQQIPEHEVVVDGVGVEGGEVRRHLHQGDAHDAGTEQPVEQDQCQIQHHQHDHGHVHQQANTVEVEADSLPMPL